MRRWLVLRGSVVHERQLLRAGAVTVRKRMLSGPSVRREPWCVLRRHRRWLLERRAVLRVSQSPVRRRHLLRGHRSGLRASRTVLLGHLHQRDLSLISRARAQMP